MRLRWAMVLILGSALAGAAQQPQPSPPDAEAVLRSTRQRLLADLDRMPRYTCVQTITRRYYRPAAEGASCEKLMTAHARGSDKLKLRGWDRLRLEVAIVDGNNVFSWVGAQRFENDTLEKLGGRGPMGSGDFGPFLYSIFNYGVVSFDGEETVNNRRLLRYVYDMPRERSRYEVKDAKGWVFTAYSGTILLDPEASDIVSLTVRTAELPEKNPACQALSELDYARTLIHDRMALIPKQTRLTTIDRTGSESVSVTDYSDCREYASKVRLLFDVPAGSAAAGAAPQALPAPTPLPSGLHFQGRIVSTIDSDTAAAGDPVEIVLRSPLRERDKAVLAPAGARLRGRLDRVEQLSGNFVRVYMRFESIEINGRTAPLRATAEQSLPHGRSLPGSLVWVGPASDSADVTVIAFYSEHLRLQKFDWSWTTLPPAEDKKATDSAGH